MTSRLKVMAFVWITGYTRLLGGMHMPESEAKKRARARDRHNNVVQIVISLRRSTDADIIEWMDDKVGKAEYIRSLIREDMKANGKVFGDEQDGV